MDWIILVVVVIAVIVISSGMKKYHANDTLNSLRSEIENYNFDYECLKFGYISHSQMEAFLKKYASLIKTLSTIADEVNSENACLCRSVLKTYNGLKAEVPHHNDEFVRAEKVACTKLFSNIAGHQLDNQQQTAIVTDEDHNIVLAGAGSGKTLTITGKVKYLCERKNINPDDILLIAFTRKAAEEMTERIHNMGVQVEAITFHKLGLTIISQARGERPEVMDDGEFREFMEDYFSNKVLDQPRIIKALIEYFAYYLHIPSDIEKFDSLGAAYEHELDTDFETLKSKYVSNKAEEFSRDRRTLQGEFVKSLEEVTIANFFFLHGVKYEYERRYPFEPDDKYRKWYTPDFYLPDYDIYLEHFGINKQGKLPWLSGVEEEKYISDMHWKRQLHRKCGTTLIETYSWFNSDGILLIKLEELLLENGVKLMEPDCLDIFQQIYNDVGDKYFHKFIQLCSTFITLFKSNGYNDADLSGLKYKSKDYKTDYHRERMRLFKSIIAPILEDYQKVLVQKEKVDFSDMIIRATQAINNGFTIHPYKYVIIDEFQDISISRYKLIKAVIEQTGAHLLCVGDDWQSIYRFSGSDLIVFTKFEEYFGASKIMRIEKTYRNSQQLIDSATKFVMKNPAQMKKALKSDKSLKMPISFFTYADKPYEAIRQAVDALIQTYGESKSILFLGRTKYDENTLLESTLFKKKREKLIYRDNPNADISFMTIHKAKGLEADNVIILNFNNSLLGFPNKIADDPILELVLSSSDTFLYGEERRLLYVALTRTRNNVVLITDNLHPSEFMHDFEGDENTCTKKIGFNDTTPVPCPKCRTGRLLIRANEKTCSYFVGCTNYPQCTYTVNDTSILTKPIRCKCGGFMVRRSGDSGEFYGCSNYPICQITMSIDSGCDYKSSNKQAVQEPIIGQKIKTDEHSENLVSSIKVGDNLVHNTFGVCKVVNMDTQIITMLIKSTGEAKKFLNNEKLGDFFNSGEKNCPELKN